MSIIELKELAPNRWKALYEGNYGTYTIRMTYDGVNASDYSCSCPSDYYPCKHIAMIEKAIKRRLTTAASKNTSDDTDVKKMLKKATHSELCKFILDQIEKIRGLNDAVYKEFAHKIQIEIEQPQALKNQNDTNKYVSILQNGFQKAIRNCQLHCSRDEYYYADDEIDIDILDVLFYKARDYIKVKNNTEAILILKTCIEEFATFLEKQKGDIYLSINDYFFSEPFVIFEEILPSLTENEQNNLLEFCKTEILKPKYKADSLIGYFNDLLMELSLLLQVDDFLPIQDVLLQRISDKDLYQIRFLLEKKIDFLQMKGYNDKVWEVIKENLQIDTFREKLVRKLIDESLFSEAKKLLDEIKPNQWGNVPVYFDNLRLEIAQKENDITQIRKITLSFLKNKFANKYYQIYKATFSTDEWKQAMEKLISTYEKNNNPHYPSHAIADVLASEGLKIRLMEYIEKYMSYRLIMNYYGEFCDEYPERTLAIFRFVIEKYTEQNVGEQFYRNIVDAFKVMKSIKGGKSVVEELKQKFQILYKRRTKMLEMIAKC